MKKEVIINATNGYLMFSVLMLALASGIYCLTHSYVILGIASLLIFIFLVPGFFIINPNNSKVLLLFGAYTGTVKEESNE